MCVILPVDHIPCTHTVAIWQHCIDAPRSKARGLAPCQRIRQHARPILTRKLCINCGGPRYFARRGGIAERGRQSPDAMEAERNEDGREANDSGYHSDTIIEEEEDDLDSEISPKASVVPVKVWRRKRTDKEMALRMSSGGMGMWRELSPGRRASWRPNLKRELTQQAFSSYRCEDVDSGAVYQSERARYMAEHAARHEALRNPATERRPLLPALDTTACESSRRKGSTLLHPSTPPDDMPSDQEDDDDDFSATHSISDIRPALRRASTLLHPSSPESPPTTTPANETPTSFSIPEQQLPPRKGSTLLHPSPPDEIDSGVGEAAGKAFPFALPTPPSSSHSDDAKRPAFQGVSAGMGMDKQRRVSIIRLATFP